MGINGSKKKNNSFRLRSLAEGIFVLIMAALLTISFNFIISQYILPVMDSTQEKELIKDYIGAVISAVSAGFVVYQLQSGEKESKRHVEVEKSEFVLNYNKSFIANDKMAEIERYLECRLTHVVKDKIDNLNKCRQEMVNYLVYLEGFASCVLSGVLGFDDIDDLFAYRFFLAMNHIEVQAMELLPYAEYYRGCYQLYDKWMDYRMTSDKYADLDYELPLYDTSLCNHYNYEKYVYPDMKVEVTEDNNAKQATFMAYIPVSCRIANLFNIKYRVKLSYETIQASGKRTISARIVSVKKGMLTSDKSLQYKKLLRMILKKAIYEKYITEIRCDQKEIIDLFNDILKTKNSLFCECYSKNLTCRQLCRDMVVRRKNLREIAKLIYQANTTEFMKLLFRRRDNEDSYVEEIQKNGEEIITEALANLLLTGKEDELFKLDNLYICEANETILGVILWNSEDKVDWYPSELKKELKYHSRKNKATYFIEHYNNDRKDISAFKDAFKPSVGDENFSDKDKIIMIATDPNADMMEIKDKQTIENVMIEKFKTKNDEVA